MSKFSGKFLVAAMALGVLCFSSMPASAGKTAGIKASLTESCSNCSTDASPAGTTGLYSLQSDGSDYDSSTVQSGILTHNTVYTLNTMNTLQNGLVGAGTRTVGMHFYSSVEGVYSNNVLPACWQGSHDQDQAVNWSIFSDNSVSFLTMPLNTPINGFARLDFNVRNGICDNQVFRFYLRWFDACITHVSSSPNTWVVTSDSCGRQTNYGEASLMGQGGKKQTFNYGDWRMPFKITLVQQ
jgi:hypothetical protein